MSRLEIVILNGMNDGPCKSKLKGINGSMEKDRRSRKNGSGFSILRQHVRVVTAWKLGLDAPTPSLRC